MLNNSKAASAFAPGDTVAVQGVESLLAKLPEDFLFADSMGGSIPTSLISARDLASWRPHPLKLRPLPVYMTPLSAVFLRFSGISFFLIYLPGSWSCLSLRRQWVP